MSTSYSRIVQTTSRIANVASGSATLIHAQNITLMPLSRMTQSEKKSHHCWCMAVHCMQYSERPLHCSQISTMQPFLWKNIYQNYPKLFSRSRALTQLWKPKTFKPEGTIATRAQTLLKDRHVKYETTHACWIESYSLPFASVKSVEYVAMVGILNPKTTVPFEIESQYWKKKQLLGWNLF